MATSSGFLVGGTEDRLFLSAVQQGVAGDHRFLARSRYGPPALASHNAETLVLWTAPATDAHPDAVTAQIVDDQGQPVTAASVVEEGELSVLAVGWNGASYSALIDRRTQTNVSSLHLQEISRDGSAGRSTPVESAVPLIVGGVMAISDQREVSIAWIAGLANQQSVLLRALADPFTVSDKPAVVVDDSPASEKNQLQLVQGRSTQLLVWIDQEPYGAKGVSWLRAATLDESGSVIRLFTILESDHRISAEGTAWDGKQFHVVWTDGHEVHDIALDESGFVRIDRVLFNSKALVYDVAVAFRGDEGLLAYRRDTPEKEYGEVPRIFVRELLIEEDRRHPTRR